MSDKRRDWLTLEHNTSGAAQRAIDPRTVRLTQSILLIFIIGVLGQFCHLNKVYQQQAVVSRFGRNHRD